MCSEKLIAWNTTIATLTTPRSRPPTITGFVSGSTKSIYPNRQPADWPILASIPISITRPSVCYKSISITTGLRHERPQL